MRVPGSLGKVIHAMRFLLDKQEKMVAVFLLAASLVISLLEVIGLAIIIPVLELSKDYGYVHRSKYLSYIYNLFGFSSEPAFIVFMVGLVLLFYIIKNLSNLYYTDYTFKYAYRVALRISHFTFNFIYSKSLNDFHQGSYSQYYIDIQNNTQKFTLSIINPLIQLVTEFFVVAIISIGIGIYSPQIFLLVICILVPLSVSIYQLTKSRLHKLGDELAMYDPLTAKYLHQGLSGFTDIVLLDKKDFFVYKYLDAVHNTNRINIKRTFFNTIPSKVFDVSAILAVALIVTYSVITHANNAELFLTLSIFVISSYRIMPSLNRIMNSLMSIKTNLYVCDILCDIEEQQRNRPQARVKGNEQALTFLEEIDIRNLSFSYNQNFGIEDLNIKINKGESIGLVGKSGSGKTTILNLLLRFLEETKGGIYVDGVKIGDEHTLSWRSKIGYVQQNTFIMDDSIRNNVAFGEPVVDEERLARVLELASLKDFVASLKEGLDTRLGEQGAKLSGGQRQRIGIARSLYRNAEILIFDEATSALDTQTEKEITDSIKKLNEEHITMILIAHRYSTLNHCDRIYELQHGKVISVSSYDQLVNKHTH